MLIFAIELSKLSYSPTLLRLQKVYISYDFAKIGGFADSTKQNAKKLSKIRNITIMEEIEHIKRTCLEDWLVCITAIVFVLGIVFTASIFG